MRIDVIKISFCLVFVLTIAARCNSDNDLSQSEESEDGEESDIQEGERPLEYVECDPLETADVPTDLHDIVALGRDSENTIYLVDEEGGHDERVFVSVGDTLYRKEIVGGGWGIDNGVETWEFHVRDDGDWDFTLAIKKLPDGETTMAVAPGDQEGSIEEIAEVGEWLEVLGEETIADYGVENLPGVQTIEYLGQVENGDYFLAVRPEHDWEDYEIGLFVGSEDEMREQVVYKMIRFWDGGTTYIYFKLEGEPATFYFEWNWEVGGIKKAYLEVGGEQYDLTLFDENTYDTSVFDFYCFE